MRQSIGRLENPRLALAVRVERTALAVRYVGLLCGISILVLDLVPWTWPDLVVGATTILAHNLFVHVVIATRRYHIFRTPLNLFLYLTETTLVVGFTGSEESPLFVFYLFLLAGYSAYSGRFNRTVGVAVLCCLAYGTAMAVEFGLVGIVTFPGIIAAKLLSILAFGWLVGQLGQFLRSTEEESATHAQALEASEAALRATLDSTPEPIWVCDEREVICDVNEHACRFLALSRGELLGKRLRTYLFDGGVLSDGTPLLHPENEYQAEEIMVNADGEERTVDLHIRSFERDRRRYFVVAAHDITAQKGLHEATRLANVDLARLNRELSKLNQLKTRFLASVSAKIKSPLTAVLGFLDMVAQEEFGPITPDQRKALQASRRSVRRVFHLLDEASHVGLSPSLPSEPPESDENAPTYDSERPLSD